MVNRISGLSSSGLNIDDVVSKLMKAERVPLTQLTQKKQILNWQKDDYRNMNTKILELKTNSFLMKQPTTFSANTTSSSDETAVSAKATASAAAGNYKLLVKQLAEGANATSTSKLGATASTDLLSAIDPTFTATTLTISGEKGSATIAVDPSNSISSFVSAVNAKSSTTGVSLKYDSTADQFFFLSTGTGSAAKVDLSTPNSTFINNVLKLTPGPNKSGGVITGAAFNSPSLVGDTGKIINSSLAASQTFRIQYTGITSPVDITISNTSTIGSVINSINNSAIGQAGVSAYLDKTTGELKFTNPDAAKLITFSDQTPDATDILASLGLNGVASAGAATTFSNKTVSGKNAIVNFNVNTIDTVFKTNTFTIADITFTAKKANVNGLLANPNTDSTGISVTQDTDTIYNSIKSFVDKYNDVISTVNSKISEQKFRDFAPLTDDQKVNMKDVDITNWNAKAMSGLIAKDSILSGGLSTFRTGLSSVVSGLPSGAVKQLSEIGISTSANYLDKGKLVIDETKLRTAISNSPDQVKSLFISDDGLSTSEAGDGIAVRIYNEATDLINRVTVKSGNQYSLSTSYLIGAQLDNMDKQILSLTTRLTNKENSYYTKFTAMDTALNKLNQQSTQLTQMLSGK